MPCIMFSQMIIRMMDYRLPRMERLRQPNLSPERESVPHCNTTADGLYDCMTCVIIFKRLSLAHHKNATVDSYRLEDLTVVVVRDTVPERDIARIGFSFANPSILRIVSDWNARRHQVTNPQVASTGKVFSVFMEADCHYTIRGVESFFNAIAVMTVYVNV
jgi:hypothetical protein